MRDHLVERLVSFCRAVDSLQCHLIIALFLILCTCGDIDNHALNLGSGYVALVGLEVGIVVAFDHGIFSLYLVGEHGVLFRWCVFNVNF